MKELSSRQVNINDLFWSPRLEVNATHAIFRQWEQLEATRCIDNFLWANRGESQMTVWVHSK